ncbi:SDR family NAD(P)-dependent oxidoreductase [Microlunatus sp. GCM10028923]|uniref:SDR family NAD(P)-dependent oxidoreductase n=1 Tax=Microlunatus sp. GCM10028923 TaxID=3273400 RepID=UPI00360E7849
MPYPLPDVSARSLSELISLDSRSAVITGGARGLGKAIARRLVEAGARVMIADLDGDLARTAAADLESIHEAATVTATRLDVTDAGSVAACADAAVAELGGLDVWVNNAGIFPSLPALDLPEETWDQVFAVNTRGVFTGSREAARRMTDGGVIVNVISTAGFRGQAPGLSAYVGSKHAVRGLTRQLALEFGPRGIRVLGVAPTFVPTEGNLAAAAANGVDPAAMASFVKPSLIGRLGTPDDIARVVLFCASDLSMIMTGSTLLADAGETI